MNPSKRLLSVFKCVYIKQTHSDVNISKCAVHCEGISIHTVHLGISRRVLRDKLDQFWGRTSVRKVANCAVLCVRRPKRSVCKEDRAVPVDCCPFADNGLSALMSRGSTVREKWTLSPKDLSKNSHFNFLTPNLVDQPGHLWCV